MHRTRERFGCQG